MTLKKWQIALPVGIAGTLIAGYAMLPRMTTPAPETSRTIRPLLSKELELDPAIGTSVTREDFEHELLVLEQELEQHPEHLPILMRMSEVEWTLGNRGGALERLRAAAALEPDNAEVRLELGRALYETGDVEGALLETQLLVNNDPSNVDALYNLGAIYGNMRNEELARMYWLEAVNLDSDSESGRLAQAGLAKLLPVGHPTLPDVP